MLETGLILALAAVLVVLFRPVLSLIWAFFIDYLERKFSHKIDD
ncbi:hypothetical protein Fbal_2454 [Ferrimonas balearica DSM 9799]|uniref:Uncharacterized protein n=1 Tax=Ferrimonas balearica (strain DSM 9799 / CCM 4581 / KCTC 23876 / PAT) TaxID=550540 RepID=E1SMY7_FERBD|nr:hypothetical protein [Ferrimonas balearica]ADN76656.1 hypothetical protein Fbal_2454 [Ferrimonas balearica DSM 9799]